ncbi:MAG: histidine kinase [Halobacteriovorax sp.]|nr:histidine kinase [Halobacteriovorax sp.]|tara:strand:+ start:265504 stop:266091 length:588 start_codon:yes stop_codon:yes gene_type:complete
MDYPKKITKEEINELPMLKFEGEIILITNQKSAIRAVNDLKKESVIGFDTETRPSFKKGETYDVSLLQLSNESTSYLFRLHKFDFPRELADLMADEKIIKSGVAIRDDVIGLQKLHPFEEAGFFEIADEAKAQGYKNFGLRALTAIFLGKRLSKKAKITNWEQARLTPAQLEYAALDAWVGLQIYHRINGKSPQQ